MAWKDLFDVAGTPTTAGSATRADAPAATTDAAIVRTLTEAGMVCLGKTNLSEFAFSGLGINRWFGTPANPLDPARLPGGSSSGSAVAVALGLTPLAIGTDTSGSVRVPAAFCGLVGFKASTGRYDTSGMIPLAPTLDSVGVLARQVADVLAIDTVLSGTSHVDASAAGPPHVVVPTGELFEDCAPTVAAAFTEAAEEVARRMRDGLNQDVEPDPDDLFRFVYAEPTPQLTEQLAVVHDELTRDGLTREEVRR